MGNYSLGTNENNQYKPIPEPEIQQINDIFDILNFTFVDSGASYTQNVNPDIN